jgi:hypothetical protein
MGKVFILAGVVMGDSHCVIHQSATDAMEALYDLQEFCPKGSVNVRCHAFEGIDYDAVEWQGEIFGEDSAQNDDDDNEGYINIVVDDDPVKVTEIIAKLNEALAAAAAGPNRKQRRAAFRNRKEK